MYAKEPSFLYLGPHDNNHADLKFISDSVYRMDGSVGGFE